MPQTYPIMLGVSDKPVVIIGGGSVAARKARGLLEAGATRIRCISPEFCEDLPDEVERVPETYRAIFLDGAKLVFAATDQADVNDAVVRDAHERNLLVNRADGDEEDPGDFSVPAKFRQEEIVVTVSAGSPALSAFIRDRLEDAFDPRWPSLAAAMRELRPLIKSASLPIANRRTIFRELASQEALEVVFDRGTAGLREWLLARHPELINA